MVEDARSRDGGVASGIEPECVAGGRGLDERMHAEPLGHEQHVPYRSKSETARWIPAVDTVWRWTTANSSRGSPCVARILCRIRTFDFPYSTR